MPKKPDSVSSGADLQVQDLEGQAGFMVTYDSILAAEDASPLLLLHAASTTSAT